MLRKASPGSWRDDVSECEPMMKWPRAGMSTPRRHRNPAGLTLELPRLNSQTRGPRRGHLLARNGGLGLTKLFAPSPRGWPHSCRPEPQSPSRQWCRIVPTIPYMWSRPPALSSELGEDLRDTRMVALATHWIPEAGFTATFLATREISRSFGHLIGG